MLDRVGTYAHNMSWEREATLGDLAQDNEITARGSKKKPVACVGDGNWRNGPGLVGLRD